MKNLSWLRRCRPIPTAVAALALVAALVAPAAAQDSEDRRAGAPSGGGLEPSGEAPPTSLEPTPIDDSYLVILDVEPAAPGEAGALAAVDRVTGELGREAEIQATFNSAVVGFAVDGLSAEEAEELAEDPAVAYVEQNQVFTIAAGERNIPTWGRDRIDQRGPALDSADTTAGDGAGVTAYIVDTGVLLTHEQFGRRVLDHRNFTGDGINADCNGHGTHVAGTVGGRDYGVAPAVDLVGIKVLTCNGSGTTAGIVAGLDWIAANAQRPAVANMSLGGPVSPAMDQATARLVASGVTTVVAAGNSTIDACQFSPARTPSALTVGSTERGDYRSVFSNYGTCVDLFAPGTDVLSAWPFVPGTRDRSTTAWTFLSGTSMASPHVAGVVARHLQTNPGATPSQVERTIESSATPGVVRDARGGSPNLLLHSDVAGRFQVNDAPDAAPANACTYTVTNDSAETIWVLEYFGRGVTPFGPLGVGQTRSYTMSGEYNENFHSLLIQTGGDWGAGTIVAQFQGRCGSAFTYPENDEPGPDCDYTVVNNSAETIWLAEYHDPGGIEDTGSLAPGATGQYTMQPTFDDDWDGIVVNTGGRWEDGYPVDEFRARPCGSTLIWGAEQPEGGSVRGTVRDTAGEPVDGLVVDLFSSNEAGERLGWLGATTTSADGSYGFDLEAGCSALTFIAPDGRRFTNGQAWLNAQACVVAGETVIEIDATLDAGGVAAAGIGDRVGDTDGAGVGGVDVDLFTANADGTRGAYLRSTSTGAAGGYGFEVDPGCYVVTFIAPEGRMFTNDSAWLNRFACVEAGQTDDSIDATLLTVGDPSTIGGQVADAAGVPAAGVAVDLFTASADGQRGDFLEQVATGADGRFQVTAAGGCYVVTFIAPDGRAFTNGRTWLNQPLCVRAGEASTGNDATLS